MTAAELARNVEAFQIKRSYKNSYDDWLSAILAIERIHLEGGDTTSKLPAAIATRDEQLDQMRRRLYAVKLKGDDMAKAKRTAQPRSRPRTKFGVLVTGPESV